MTRIHIVFVVAFITALGAGAYYLGSISGADVDAAQARNETAGAAAGAQQGTVQGEREGTAAGTTKGVAAGRKQSYQLAYLSAYKSSRKKAYDAALKAEQQRQALEAEIARRKAEQANMEGGPAGSGASALPHCDAGVIGACYDPLTGNVLS